MKVLKRCLISFLCFILALVLLAFTILFVIPVSENRKNKENPDALNWMEDLLDTKLLSELYLPGTHDSGTNNCELGFFSKCQNTDIYTQLQNGYRYLDIRLAIADINGEQKLKLVHGFTSCKEGIFPWSEDLLLDSVLSDCYQFLEENPSETIVFAVKNENKEDDKSTLQTLLLEYIQKNQDAWLLQNTIPTLGQSRGKIVLMRRYSDELGLGESAGIPLFWKDQDGYSDAAITSAVSTYSGYTLLVQDRYEYNLEEKWNAFLDAIENAESGCDLAIHFLSTKGHLTYGHPYYFASKLNKKFKKEEPELTVGWYVFDFADSELAKQVYEKNY